MPFGRGAPNASAKLETSDIIQAAELLALQALRIEHPDLGGLMGTRAQSTTTFGEQCRQGGTGIAVGPEKKNTRGANREGGSSL